MPLSGVIGGLSLSHGLSSCILEALHYNDVDLFLVFLVIGLDDLYYDVPLLLF